MAQSKSAALGFGNMHCPKGTAEGGAVRFVANATGAVPFDSLAAGAEEVDDSAGRGESVALGRGQADIECGFELIAEFD